jgi:DNA-binding PadR family transcriptional regulator
MKIEKYLLMHSSAARVAAKKLGIEPPTHHALATLAAVSIVHPIHYSALYRYMDDRHYNSHATLYRSLTYLLEAKLIDRSDYTYRLSPLGREYLTRIRKYLLNVRL